MPPRRRPAIMADPQLQIDLARDSRSLQISPFTGFDHPNPRSWIQQFQNKTAALLIPPERAVRLLLSLFAADALDWLAALPQATRTDLDAMYAAFNDKYVQRDLFTRENDAGQFYSLNQTPNQSVHEFATILRNLGAKLGLPADQIVQKLWASVRPEIKQRCALVTRPAEIDAAISLLQQAERTMLASTAAMLMSATVGEEKPVHPGTDPTLLAAITALTDAVGGVALRRGNATRTAYDQRAQRRPLVCWYCSREGHVRRHCRRLQQDERDNRTLPRAAYPSRQEHRSPGRRDDGITYRPHRNQHDQMSRDEVRQDHSYDQPQQELRRRGAHTRVADNPRDGVPHLEEN